MDFQRYAFHFKFNVFCCFFFFFFFFFGGGGGEGGYTVWLYHMERTLVYYGLTFVNNGFVFTLYHIEDIFISKQKSTELYCYIELFMSLYAY